MPTSNHSAMWLCRCVCGAEKTLPTAGLNNGKSVSCGCKRGTHRHTSAGARTPTYASWQNMLARCFQPSNPAFAYYRSRGITVCERWRAFENFLSDMGDRAADTTLDRIDNSGGYEPGNCRWATKREQANNRITNLRFSWRGAEYTLADLARASGVSKDILRERLCRQDGWTVERAIETPVRKHISRSK